MASLRTSKSESDTAALMILFKTVFDSSPKATMSVKGLKMNLKWAHLTIPVYSQTSQYLDELGTDSPVWMIDESIDVIKDLIFDETSGVSCGRLGYHSMRP